MCSSRNLNTAAHASTLALARTQHNMPNEQVGQPGPGTRRGGGVGAISQEAESLASFLRTACYSLGRPLTVKAIDISASVGARLISRAVHDHPACDAPAGMAEAERRG